MQLSDPTVLLTIAILFFGTLVRSTLGFGEALIAVPLLALLMPIKQAAPIAVLVSITIAFIILLVDWRDVHLDGAWRLIFSTVFGIPLGLWLLTAAPEATIQAALGAIIIVFSAMPFLIRQQPRLTNDRWAWLAGFLAGILGGAYGINGPPLAYYGALRRWSPEVFRGTLQAYFLPASALGMGGYAATGLWTPPVTQLFLLSLPAVILAIFLGRAINRRLHPERFVSYVYAGLLLIGAVLVWQSFSSAHGVS